MIIDIDADQKSLNLVVQPQHSREREHTTAHIDSSTSVIRTRLSPPLYAAAISRVHWSHAPEWVNTKRISNVVCFQPDCFPCHLLTKRPSVSIPSNQQIQTIQKDPSSRLSHKKMSSHFSGILSKRTTHSLGAPPMACLNVSIKRVAVGVSRKQCTDFLRSGYESYQVLRRAVTTNLNHGLPAQPNHQ